MSKEITGVILAGGRGFRMGVATEEVQKCMLPIEGKPILQHILDNIQTAFGSADIIIATGHQGDSVRQNFGSKYGNIKIEYVGSPEHLETRRRLLLAQGLIKGPFLYTAGDVISNPDQLNRIVDSFEKERGSGILGVISGATDHTPAMSHAIITTDQNRAVEIVYPPTSTWDPQQVREMNIAYYDMNFFYRLRYHPAQQPFILPVIADALKQGEQFAVEKYFDRWYHFAEPEDLGAAIVFDTSPSSGSL